jgi:uncharacterized DUF497 family protein
VAEELKYPHWQRLFQDAVWEFNPREHRVKLRSAETVLQDRLQVLSTDRAQKEERHALLDALSTINGLKKISRPVDRQTRI